MVLCYIILCYVLYHIVSLSVINVFFAPSLDLFAAELLSAASELFITAAAEGGAQLGSPGAHGHLSASSAQTHQPSM